MLRQTAEHIITTGIVLTGLMTTPLCAQTRAGSTPSHRFLPTGTAPQRSDFETPDFQKALQDFKALRELRNTLRRSRASGSQLPEVKPESTLLPGLDTTVADKLPLETQELMRQWSQNSVTEVTQQIGRELVEFNRQLTQRSGLPESTPNQNDIPFDFSRDVVQRIEDVSKAYYEQRSLVNSAYSEARRQFRNRWPSERIPPREWIERVQPFINSEILEQLAKVRDYQDGKLSAPPEIPKSLLTSKPPPSLSERMIESVVRTVDQGGNELLKRAKRNNQGKKNTSWWKEFKNDANTSLKSWNKSITDRTESFASSSGLTVDSTDGGQDSPGRANTSDTITTPSANGLLLIFGLGLFLAGCGYLYYRRVSRQYRPGRWTELEMTADAIQDRDSLLQAVHGLAIKRLGTKSRFWHHRQLLDSLNEKLDSQHSEIDALYERARYAPDGDLISREDIELVRGWYQRAQRVRCLQS